MKAIDNLHAWNSAGGGPIDAEKYSDIVGSLKKPFYPEMMSIPRAFTFFKPAQTRVVILGQAPFPSPGKASGLAFGFHKDYEGPTNSSLRNILTVAGDTSDKPETSLEPWARQGVLLMNTIWTVSPGEPLSHAGIGWEEITADVLRYLDFNYQNRIVYLLFGTKTQAYAKYLKYTSENMILKTSHPCRYSAHRGFMDSNIFVKANARLVTYGRKPIEWVKKCDP